METTLFSELFRVASYRDGVHEYVETHRWIRYEEHVENRGGQRWSAPHASTPALVHWMAVRNTFGYDQEAARMKHPHVLVLPDLEASGPDQLYRSICSELARRKVLGFEQAIRLKAFLLGAGVRHHFQGPRRTESTLISLLKRALLIRNNPDDIIIGGASGIVEGEAAAAASRANNPFKKVPEDLEAAVIFEGVPPSVVDNRPVVVLARLKEACLFDQFPEIAVPTRFFVLVCSNPAVHANPLSATAAATESDDDMVGRSSIGYAIGACMTNPALVRELYAFSNEKDLSEALDAHTKHLCLIPREWNKEHLILPPSAEASLVQSMKKDEAEELDEDRRMREQSGLVRTGRPFGGLLGDVRRKRRFYLSDLTHFNPQCLSALFFIYFAALAPIVALGGLLGQATGNRIATIECLVSGLICGATFALFSGQPLIILGLTGPVYVFEKILYSLCDSQGWDYLSLRLWIGIWVGVFLLSMVATDFSAFVCYITRFTEEIFAVLCAAIYVYNSVSNLVNIGDDIEDSGNGCQQRGQQVAPTGGGDREEGILIQVTSPNLTEESDLCVDFLPGQEDDLDAPASRLNVILMSVMTYVGTMMVAVGLKSFKTAPYLPCRVRGFLADFSMVIAILAMTLTDHLSGVATPKLNVPSEFKPTWEGRNWAVAHAKMFSEHVLSNPWWVDVFLAPVLALLATVLIFMDQQITAVIVNRRDNLLTKGCGYHLDLLIVAFLVIVCSVFGLPWMVAENVISVNHIQALAKLSTNNAPGEKPVYLGASEQRVTGLLVAVLIGLSTLLTPALAWIPMPVLFAVFCLMGLYSLRGIQFVDRLMLLLVPAKFQHKYTLLKYVRLKRVHLFTLIQMASFAVLWIMKFVSVTSIAFPVLLLAMCGIRKMLDYIFTSWELRVLDDLLPNQTCVTKKDAVKDLPPSDDHRSRMNLEEPSSSSFINDGFDDGDLLDDLKLTFTAPCSDPEAVKKLQGRPSHSYDSSSMMMLTKRTTPYAHCQASDAKVLLVCSDTLGKSTMNVFVPLKFGGPDCESASDAVDQIVEALWRIFELPGRVGPSEVENSRVVIRNRFGICFLLGKDTLPLLQSGSAYWVSEGCTNSDDDEQEDENCLHLELREVFSRDCEN